MSINQIKKIFANLNRTLFDSKKPLVFLSATIAIGLIFTFSSFGNDKFSGLFGAGGKNAPAKKQGSGFGFAGLAEIKGIDTGEKTISVLFQAGSNSMKDLRFKKETLTVDSNTVFIINKENAGFADLKAGDTVFIYGRKTFKSILNIEKIEVERK